MIPNAFAGGSQTSTDLIYKPNGTKYPATVTSSAYGPKTGTSMKVSVDTGVFLPGVFRCNPYTVGCQQFVREDNLSLHATWEDTWYKYHSTVNGKLLTQFLYANSGMFSGVGNDLRQDAVTRAFAKLGSSNLDMLTELGELRETIGTLISPFSSARKFLERKANKGFRDFADVIKYRRTGKFRNEKKGGGAKSAASDTWMEIRYGLMPIYRTVQQVLEYLYEETVKPSQNIRSVRSYLRNIEGKRTVSNTLQTDASQLWRIPVTIIIEDSIDALGCVFFRQEKAWSRATELGLDKRYLPEVMWELTSRSFVWDWFLGIGDTLALFRENPEQVVLGSSGSIKVTRKTTCKAGNSYIASRPSITCGNTAQGVATYTRFERVCGLQPSYVPIFYGTSKLSLAKMIDLAIMGNQSIIKGTQKFL